MRSWLLVLVLALCGAGCGGKSPTAPEAPKRLQDCTIKYVWQPDGSLKPINSCDSHD